MVERDGLKIRSGPNLSKSIAFISTMNGYAWGGSEELWSRTALELVLEGWSVGASVCRWSPPHQRIVKLAEAGIDVQSRRVQHQLWRRIWDKVLPNGMTPLTAEVDRFLSARTTPALIVLSDGAAFHPTELLELCVSRRLPFATISQANYEDFWPVDRVADQYRRLLPAARRCYFVSAANHRLFEKQIGRELKNAEVVFNPFDVGEESSPPWPKFGHGSELRFACVGRLHPPSKGQDILLEALADPLWQSRSWRLSFYGEGPMRNGIERLVQRFGLLDRVRFAGYVTPVEKIWTENHVLVMPSRYEGMPLAMVEAMLCARPAVATDVAGHSEVIRDGITGFLADAPTALSMRRALERLWERRMDLEAIGKAAARSIREHMPRDPIKIFARKIKALANIGNSLHK
jgi:glycosyltransferase involved in cell wall biosynthesis